MKRLTKIMLFKKVVFIGIGFFIFILSVIYIYVYMDGSSPQHLVWKSSYLGDSTGYDTLASRVWTFISRLNLVDPHRPVWKSFSVSNSLAANINP